MDNTDVKRQIVTERKITHARLPRSQLKKRKKSAGNLLTAKAIPFRSTMVDMLRKLGFSVNGTSLKFILVRFYNEFSGKKPLDEKTFINNVAFKIDADEGGLDAIADARNRTGCMEVLQLVNEVIGLFTNAKKEYQVVVNYGMEPGRILSEEKIQMAKATMQIERELLKKDKKDHFVRSGEFNRTLYWLLGFGILIWLISKL